MATGNKMTTKDQVAGLEALAQDQEKAEVEGKGRGLLTKIRNSANLPAEDWGDDRLTALIRFLDVPRAKLPDYAAFFSMATRYKLDPFAGQIFLFPTRGGKLKVAVERDGLLKVAQDHPDYLGYFSAAIYENDEFHFKQNGQPGLEGIEILHEFDIDRGDLVAAFCVVYRKDWPPQMIFRQLSEYSHLMSKDNWRDNPADMLETRCIAASLRRMFSLHGMYTPGELMDSDTHAPDGVAKDATANNLADLKARVDKMGTGAQGSGVEDVPEGDFEVVEVDGVPVEDPDAEARAAEQAEVAAETPEEPPKPKSKKK